MPTAAERDAAVLAALLPVGLTAAPVCRRLNPPIAAGPCDWCPVGPPRPGAKLAPVPQRSRAAVAAALARLARAGLVEHHFPGSRHAFYCLPSPRPEPA